MFCGFGFCMTPQSETLFTTYTDNINYVSLKSGIYDEFFGSQNESIAREESSKCWDYDTLFFAKFQNSLLAGNVQYSADLVNKMLIKRKKKDEFNWLTLFEINIETNEDFTFERIDRYARAQTDYQYTLIPVMSGVEGELNITDIRSEFDGSFFVDKDVSYASFMYLKINTQKNHTGTSVTTLGSK